MKGIGVADLSSEQRLRAMLVGLANGRPVYAGTCAPEGKGSGSGSGFSPVLLRREFALLAGTANSRFVYAASECVSVSYGRLLGTLVGYANGMSVYAGACCLTAGSGSGSEGSGGSDGSGSAGSDGSGSGASGSDDGSGSGSDGSGSGASGSGSDGSGSGSEGSGSGSEGSGSGESGSGSGESGSGSEGSGSGSEGSGSDTSGSGESGSGSEGSGSESGSGSETGSGSGSESGGIITECCPEGMPATIYLTLSYASGCICTLNTDAIEMTWDAVNEWWESVIVEMFTNPMTCPETNRWRLKCNGTTWTLWDAQSGGIFGFNSFTMTGTCSPLALTGTNDWFRFICASGNVLTAVITE